MVLNIESLLSEIEKTKTESKFGLISYAYLMNIILRQRTKPCTIICGDINGLGLYNTQHGIEAGDEQYRKILQQIKSSIPDGAEIVRVGGDEIVIIIDDDSYDNLSSKKTRDYISRINSTKVDGLELSITLGGANADNSSSLLQTFRAAFSNMEAEKDKYREQREAGKSIDDKINELTRSFLYTLKTGDDEQIYLSQDELTILLSEIYKILESENFDLDSFENPLPEITIPSDANILPDGWQENLDVCREILEQMVKNPITGLYRRSYFVDTIIPNLKDNNYGGMYFFDITGLKLSNEANGHKATDMRIEEVVTGIEGDLSEQFGIKFNEDLESNLEDYIINLGSGRFVILTKDACNIENIVSNWREKLSDSPLGLSYASIDMLGMQDGVNITQDNFPQLISDLEKEANLIRKEKPDDIMKKFNSRLLVKYIGRSVEIYKQMIKSSNAIDGDESSVMRRRNELSRRIVNWLIKLGINDPSCEWYMPPSNDVLDEDEDENEII